MKAQEIVTKAVIGKGKKKTKKVEEVKLSNVDNVLGCWVINHRFEGVIENGNIYVDGVYDINIWYSFDNNTKTNVFLHSANYRDEMNVTLKEGLGSDNQIIVRSLNQPSVTDVLINEDVISLTIEKEMSIEVIGDTFVNVTITDEKFDYEEIEDTKEIDTDYLK